MLAGTLPSSEYLIATTVLTQNEPSVTFNNLDQFAGVYKHLQIVYVGRSTINDTIESTFIRFNGVNTASYSRHRLRGSGANINSAGDFSTTSIQGTGVLAGATLNSSIFSAGIIDILDPFSNSKNTTTKTFDGLASSVNWVGLQSGAFYSTAPVTSITIFSETGANLATGSRFSLYGVTA
jgi:hypothetical protein